VITVFGASGFLGSEICNSIFTSSVGINAVMRESSNPWRLANSDLIEKTYLDPRDWSQLLIKKQPKVVIAANWDGVKKDQRQNKVIQSRSFESVLELAQISKRIDSDLFIAFGSQAEVPDSDEPIEEKLFEPQGNEYGQAKTELAKALQEIFIDSKTRLIWVRPFSIYGPRDSSESLIPQMFHAAKLNLPFEVRETGLAWSALHISDFGNAMRRIISSEGLSGVVNIGNPNATSIYEFAKVASDSIGKIFPNWDGLNLSLKPHKIGKIPKMDKVQDLEWAPKFSLVSGVDDTVNWLSANPLTEVSKKGWP
jgi:nucleoside-diphosphate-sugar epimerase